MPRPNKGYQLAFRTPKGYAAEQWVVFWSERGNKYERATGLLRRDQLAEAEEWRRQFVGSRERPSGPLKPDQMTVAQALNYYAVEHAPTVVDGARIGYAIKALLPFWGDMPVASVKGETCRRYARERKVRRAGKVVRASAATVRRELGVLNAAFEHCRVEGYLLEAPAVWLPEPTPGRDRWLTRSESAALLRAAKGEHLARLHLPTFILLGLYTGHRAAAITSLQWQPNMSGGHVDLERGIINFNAVGQRRTNKRRSIIPIPPGLMVHLRAVRRRTRQYVIEVDGQPVKSVKKAFNTAVRKADPGGEARRAGTTAPGLPGVVRHTMRHTACTWFMQRGVDIELAAAWVGMEVDTFRRKYMHHHPDYMQEVTDSFRRKIPPATPPATSGKQR